MSGTDELSGLHGRFEVRFALPPPFYFGPD